MVRHRVGVIACGNPADPGLWSGTPSNMLRALDRAGVDAVPVDVTAPATRAIVDVVAAPDILRYLPASGLRLSMHRGRLAAGESMLLARARSARARTLLRRLGEFDGVVQVGTGYRVRHDNVVSYEDMTVPQAVREPDYLWSDVSERRRRARTKQQAAAYQRLRSAAFATEWAARSARDELGCPAGKALVVGIGPNFAPPMAVSRDWDTPRFLFVGREWKRKNGEMVVRAFVEAQKDFPDAELHLVGDHPRTDVRGVIGHGYLSLRDPASRQLLEQLWATATCCVVPSRFEPAGIIYVEAMHAGIPAIGTSRGGARCVIGDAGVVVDPDSQSELVTAMQEYCDPMRLQRAGAAAQARSAMFTWDIVARHLLTALSLHV